MVLTDSFPSNRRTLSRHIRGRREGQTWRIGEAENWKGPPAMTPGRVLRHRGVPAHNQGYSPLEPARDHETALGHIRSLDTRYRTVTGLKGQ